MKNLKIGDKLWYGDGIITVDENVLRDFEIYKQSGIRAITQHDVDDDTWKDLQLLKLANFLGEQEVKLNKILKGETKDDIFTELCKPLMKYLAENHHPHTKIILESNFAELVEGVKTTGQIDDFVVD